MPKYQEQIATGETWVRCRTVVIDNLIDSTPACQFGETRATSVGGVTSEQYIGTFSSEFTPTADIPLRDPETGDLTGSTVTQAYLYQILYSLYMQKALERDAQA